MIFPNLWGLLLLLAIPVLILIYIIKREHRERAVSGTYLWHLSERFLKKRIPIKRLSVFLTFLLQLTILSLFALSAMQPAMALGQFSGKIVVIDASASMLTEQDGVSRFDAAVEKAKDLAESGLCSSMTVIVASDTPACLVMGGSMSEALDALDSAVCGYGGMDLYEAMKLVREASSRIGLAGRAQVILYTDTEFADVENVEVVDMRRGEKNLAVTELTYSAGEFQGTLVSFGEDREVSAGLYVDGELLDIQTVPCLDGVPATVQFDTRKTSFETATLRVELEDSLGCDNSFSIAGPRSDPVSVLVLGKEVLFFEKGFEALGNCEVTVKESYHKNDEGLYDLYIFSSCVPHQDTFPKTGVTIGFAQYKEGWSFLHSLLNSFHVTDGYYGNTGVEFLYDRNLEIDPIWDGMENAMQNVYIRHFNLTHNTFLSSHEAWDSLLGTSTHSKEVVFRRILENDARHYLFMFPLSQTNLALTPAFLMLLKNACGIAAPPVWEKSHYSVGETVDLSPQTGATSLVMTSPDGTVTEMADSETSFIPTAPGLYTLTYEVDQKPPEPDPSSPGEGLGFIDWGPIFGDGTPNMDTIPNDSETNKAEPRTRTASFFAHIPPSEYETFSGETIYYNNTHGMDPGGKTVSSTLLPFTAVILTALLILEWGYFYRGKH